MRNKLYKIFAASFMLAMAFTFSCSSDNGDDNGGGGGGGSFNVNPQVYVDASYRDDNDVYHYKIETYKGSGNLKKRAGVENETLIDVGIVKNGIVNLNLPKSIPNEYLEDFLDDETQSSCTSYPKGIKTVGSDRSYELIDSNGEYIGRLEPAYYDGQIEEQIMYMYFSKTGKITCNLGNTILNIDAKEGWNVVYRKDIKTGNKTGNKTERKVSTDRNILTNEKDIKWVIRLED